MPACSYHDFPLSDNPEWDASEAERDIRKWASSDGSGDKDKIDWSKYSQVNFWHESGELNNFTQFKFPYCRIENGRPHVVHNAVQNGLARLDGSSIPDDEKDAVRRVMNRQMERFNENKNNSIYNRMSLSKPTTQQLDKIKEVTGISFNPDDVFVFNDLMIDNLVTSYYTTMHPNLLNTFLKDVKKGVPLMMGHETEALPVGRSFDGYIETTYDTETGNIIQSLYGMFYIDLDRGTSYGLNTNDIVKGINSGVISDTSIGFDAKSWKCSICGNDIFDFQACPHWPGEEYEIEEDGKKRKKTCTVSVGDDGVGELIENSLVYAGACDRAVIMRPSESNDGSYVRTDLVQLSKTKGNINPLEPRIYKDKNKLDYTICVDTNTTDKEQLGGNDTRMTVEDIKHIFEQYSFNADSEESIDKVLADYVALSKDVEAKNVSIAELSNKVAELEANITELTNKYTADVETLKVQAELGKAYVDDLKQSVIESGIRAEGNEFPKELFTKFVDTLSVDELKDLAKVYEKKADTKFDKSRIYTPTNTLTDDVITKDSFATEEEFREYVAKEAQSYSKKHNISIKEATKIVYHNLMGDEE